MIPSFSEALAFHIRTLPSSEPDSTKRASAVNIDEETLHIESEQRVLVKIVSQLTFASV